MIETGANGINGDTMPGVNVSFWDEGILQGKAMAIEPEIMQVRKTPSWPRSWANFSLF